MELRYILVTIGCLLIGISGDDANVACRKIDFNKMNSIDLFEPCSGTNGLVLKSYEDNPIVSRYNEDSVNYLSNSEAGWSCLTTVEQFILKNDTEFSLAIFLQSVIFDDMSQVEIEVIDLDAEGAVIPVTNAMPTPVFKWTLFNVKFGRRVLNAKISIRAYVSVAARLAIQYLHILNPGIDESSCEIEDETTTEMGTTTEETDNTCRACACACTCTFN